MDIINSVMDWFKGNSPCNFVRIPLQSKGKLFVSPAPFGPYDTSNTLFKQYLEHKVKIVLCLLTDEELTEKNKKKLELCRFYEEKGLRALRLPFADLTAPPYDALSAMVPQLVSALHAGKNIVIHCNAGVGRTGIVSACVSASMNALSGHDAIEHVKSYMMVHLSDEQERIVKRWA